MVDCARKGGHSIDFDLVIANGHVVSPRETIRADVGIRDGKVSAVGDLAGAESCRVYDASGGYVLPGLIDEHVHSRDPGLTYKEDFAHSTRAAAAGGFTTVFEMPNSVPPVLDAALFAERAEHLRHSAFVDFGLWGMILGDLNTQSLVELAEAGVIGFKFFWGYALERETLAIRYEARPGEDVLPPPDDGQIYDAFAAAGTTGRPVAVHAESNAIISRLAARERNGGNSDYAAYLRSRPAFTEAVTVQAAIAIAEAAGAHLHVLHVSAGEVVDLIALARARAGRVTGEACPHHLVLTDEDYERAGVEMKTFTPVRGRADQARLWEGLNTGQLQTIGSDHAPHSTREKAGDLWTALPGVAGVQTAVPLMLDEVAHGRLTLNQLVALLSENPARVFGVYGQKGTLAPGADGDCVVIDMERTVQVRREDMLSKYQGTPYEGRMLRGAPVASFLRGVQVMADGQPVGSPSGRLVVPTRSSDPCW